MTLLRETGQWLIVGFFLVSGLANLTKARVADHIQRMRIFGAPFPAPTFWLGIALQLTGGALLIAGWHPALGVGCLIVFTVVATGIFHRFWQKSDPVAAQPVAPFLPRQRRDPRRAATASRRRAVRCRTCNSDFSTG